MAEAFPDVEFDFYDKPTVPYRRRPGLQDPTRGSGEDEDGEYFLKTPSGQLLVLGDEERLLWLLLDGSTSFTEIQARFQNEFGRTLSAANFAKFLRELIDAGVVEQIANGSRTRPDGTSIRKVELTDDPAWTGPPIPFPGSGPRGGMRGRGGAMGGRGGAMRGRGGARTREMMRMLWAVRLGNPERLLDRLTAIYWPIRYLGWLLIPLLLTAILITIKHSDQYYADYIALIISIPTWPAFWVAEHLTTWSARIVEGMVFHGFGGRITEARLKLFLGIFIRLQFEHSTTAMSRRQKLWITATPLLWRLVTFSVSIVLWAIYRPTHPVASQIAMWMAAVGAITFMTAACPLLPLYGYKFLATLLDQENLRGRAFKYLTHRMRGGTAPDGMNLAERWGLVFMALGTAIIGGLFFLHILYHANSRSIDTLGGLGFWFGIAILVISGLYFATLYRYARKLRAMQRVSRMRETPGPSAAPSLSGAAS